MRRIFHLFKFGKSLRYGFVPSLLNNQSINNYWLDYNYGPKPKRLMRHLCAQFLKLYWNLHFLKHTCIHELCLNLGLKEISFNLINSRILLLTGIKSMSVLRSLFHLEKRVSLCIAKKGESK